ncbi:hypothetical protein MRS44_017642 [Fusarium solani]|uniref:uncharacterized protein n=1 Tax=Fusarium solani TaxID=169388 RepID=UPI0032C443BE|nr:hypothetical protein MRS44_018771 [Fusarium solani]KAJ3453395.1 hypothetical protein MRS44_017642 [Fusarium solani]
MDDPSWAWPAWKFGMKSGDLFTKLHSQYNTYLCPIQDPDAFHHDIFEISHKANSAAEFHHLTNNRSQQRLHELNEALESASLEIIANPSLISTPQWEHAVQLFRTKSLDSLVRYFASYLPADHIWHSSCHAFAPATSSTEPEAHSPDTEFEGIRIYDLSSNSVIDQPECFRPQTPSSLADYGEEVMGSGDDTSMMPYPNTSEAVKSGNGIPDSKRVYPAESSPENFPVKQVKHGSSHSESQTDRHLACRETAQPMTLAPSVTATLASGPSRTIITCSSSMQPTNGARAGTKRKRP